MGTNPMQKMKRNSTLTGVIIGLMIGLVLCAILYMFLTNKNKSFSRDDILNNIWGKDYFGTDRVVDDLVRRLRKKMPDININTIYIKYTLYVYRLRKEVLVWLKKIKK